MAKTLEQINAELNRYFLKIREIEGDSGERLYSWIIINNNPKGRRIFIKLTDFEISNEMAVESNSLQLIETALERLHTEETRLAAGAMMERVRKIAQMPMKRAWEKLNQQKATEGEDMQSPENKRALARVFELRAKKNMAAAAWKKWKAITQKQKVTRINEQLDALQTNLEITTQYPEDGEDYFIVTIKRGGKPHKYHKITKLNPDIFVRFDDKEDFVIDLDQFAAALEALSTEEERRTSAMDFSPTITAQEKVNALSQQATGGSRVSGTAAEQLQQQAPNLLKHRRKTILASAFDHFLSNTKQVAAEHQLRRISEAQTEMRQLEKAEAEAELGQRISMATLEAKAATTSVSLQAGTAIIQSQQLELHQIDEVHVRRALAMEIKKEEMLSHHRKLKLDQELITQEITILESKINLLNANEEELERQIKFRNPEEGNDNITTALETNKQLATKLIAQQQRAKAEAEAGAAVIAQLNQEAAAAAAQAQLLGEQATAAEAKAHNSLSQAEAKTTLADAQLLGEQATAAQAKVQKLRYAAAAREQQLGQQAEAAQADAARLLQESTTQIRRLNVGDGESEELTDLLSQHRRNCCNIEDLKSRKASAQNELLELTRRYEGSTAAQAEIETESQQELAAIQARAEAEKAEITARAEAARAEIKAASKQGVAAAQARLEKQIAGIQAASLQGGSGLPQHNAATANASRKGGGAVPSARASLQRSAAAAALQQQALAEQAAMIASGGEAAEADTAHGESTRSHGGGASRRGAALQQSAAAASAELKEFDSEDAIAEITAIADLINVDGSHDRIQVYNEYFPKLKNFIEGEKHNDLFKIQDPTQIAEYLRLYNYITTAYLEDTKLVNKSDSTYCGVTNNATLKAQGKQIAEYKGLAQTYLDAKTTLSRFQQQTTATKDKIERARRDGSGGSGAPSASALHGASGSATSATALGGGGGSGAPSASALHGASGSATSATALGGGSGATSAASRTAVASAAAHRKAASTAAPPPANGAAEAKKREEARKRAERQQAARQKNAPLSGDGGSDDAAAKAEAAAAVATVRALKKTVNTAAPLALSDHLGRASGEGQRRN
jgi:hypothetical protein